MQVIGLIVLVIFSSSLVTGEKRQSVSLEQMVHQLQKKSQKLEKELSELKANPTLAQLQREVSELKANPNFPLGFVYVQLPKEKSPAAIWPSMTWTEVSSTYAGVFFRVAGGGAGHFGYVQQENAPKLTKVDHYWCGDSCESIKSVIPLSIPSDGTWSEHIPTATSYVDTIYGMDDSKLSFKKELLRFQHSTGEVRPRNMAVKVWKRTA